MWQVLSHGCQYDRSATWKRRSASACQPPTSGLLLKCLFTLKEKHLKKKKKKTCRLLSHIKQLSWITAHFCVRMFMVHLSPTSNTGFWTAVCEHKDYICWLVLTFFFSFFFFWVSTGKPSLVVALVEDRVWNRCWQMSRVHVQKVSKGENTTFVPVERWQWFN